MQTAQETSLTSSDEANTSPLASLLPYANYPCLIYPASRILTDAESIELTNALDGFLSNWASHGSPVDGTGIVLENRFVIVAHRPQEIAGCSRDALLFFLNGEAKRLGVEWLGGARVVYRVSSGESAGTATGQTADVDRPGFRALAAAGVVTPETVVYDTTVRETAAILDGRFTPAAKDSWHARLM